MKAIGNFFQGVAGVLMVLAWFEISTWNAGVGMMLAGIFLYKQGEHLKKDE